MRGRARAAAALLGLLVFAAAPRGLDAQERGAIALGEAIEGLGVSARVLMIGAHPDDEDTFLITWLQRGRHVETAYLSLTRGDGGQNLIGNELGEALGVIRTEELLAARRIDGARQYFTRAFDFGFSKDTIDTYKHWQRDSILGDVVRVVRAFRPHVIVAVFSGTTRDGHGHHQVSGLLARAAYDVSGDTTRFPVAAYGAPWTTLKFYRAARFNQQAATLSMDVGEYSPLLGRSYGEIAGESRSQHKSQGFGSLQRKGPIIDYVRREASRVNESTAANTEKSMFDGIDTSWARFRRSAPSAFAGRQLDSLPLAILAARAAYDPFVLSKVRTPVRRVSSIIGGLLDELCRQSRSAAGCVPPDLDFALSLQWAAGRADHALRLASGIELEAAADREVQPTNGRVQILATVYNNNVDSVELTDGGISYGRGTTSNSSRLRPFPRQAVIRDTLIALVESVTVAQPWWLVAGRSGAMFASPGSTTPENWRGSTPMVTYGLGLADNVSVGARIMYRYADPVKGERQVPMVTAPALTLTFDRQTQFVPANSEFNRQFVVRVRSALDSLPRDVRVTLTPPHGLIADSASRVLRLRGPDATGSVTFNTRGRLAPGEHRVEAAVEYDGKRFSTGYDLIDYDHIRRQRIYRPASIRLSAVDVKVPGTLRVAYIPGVGDNVAPALTQLGIPVTVIAAGDIARADLTPYTSVVIGPRAYEANPELLAANPKLFDFARRGGTLVVQYGQYEMLQPGAMPYPITLARPADRVTQEDSPVTIDAPNARELTAPNRIGASDFANWVQERSLYMPRTFDEHYRALMSINDSGEAANKGGVLIAPLGDGLYIYTTLAFFRQLPAGVPGGARLFVNLLSANLAPTVTP